MSPDVMLVLTLRGSTCLLRACRRRHACEVSCAWRPSLGAGLEGERAGEDSIVMVWNLVSSLPIISWYLGNLSQNIEVLPDLVRRHYDAGHVGGMLR